MEKKEADKKDKGCRVYEVPISVTTSRTVRVLAHDRNEAFKLVRDNIDEIAKEDSREIDGADYDLGNAKISEDQSVDTIEYYPADVGYAALDGYKVTEGDKPAGYIVTITEMLSVCVAVGSDQAKSADEAERKVRASYKAGDIILDADNFSDSDFKTEEVSEGDKGLLQTACSETLKDEDD